ncbi:flavin reductase family protein [Motilibacter aurantiacus]|uniref:flavin reductase family protein n=1 Tax=Motilibacter aurantiacus TaxID=2714955 RepID=UPI00140D8D42|nr:flavin reductase family protein [Motilibacter aurantiacus]NHC45793.1 flavin reductase family protein [Motilibacter aurantiacus]
MSVVPLRPVRAREGVAPDRLRSALRRHAASVVVVTVMDGESPAGLTVSSFTAVSLQPPLVSFCIANSSSSFGAVEAADTFAVSLLGSAQADIATRFATRGVDRFAQTPWELDEHGHPVISGALAWLTCATETQIPLGDHLLVLGRVLDVRPGRTGRPLVHHEGRFAAPTPIAPHRAGRPAPGPAGRG